MTDQAVRIAMWSGPRNISTAMMRSWGSRPDTAVCDEPLYAHYLQTTGLDHPGRAEVIAAQETDWRKVVAMLTGPVPGGCQVFYQKHMAHHLLPGISREWTYGLRNILLVRDPREMLVSLARVLPRVELADTGLPQQLALQEEWIRQTGRAAPVIDAREVLRAPREALEKLCRWLDLPFDEAMLRWKPGSRETDGVWAKYWYASVEKSTGFESWRPPAGDMPPALAPLLAQCRRIYTQLYMPAAGCCP